WRGRLNRTSKQVSLRLDRARTLQDGIETIHAHSSRLFRPLTHCDLATDAMGNAPFVSRQYGYFVVELYHLERNHQGLDNRLLAPVEIIATGVVQKRERLGGLLNYYYRKAA